VVAGTLTKVNIPPDPRSRADPARAIGIGAISPLQSVTQIKLAGRVLS
jgi:hypothetical protein